MKKIILKGGIPLKTPYKMKPKTYFKRPCERCGETYQPTTRSGKVCDNCKTNPGSKNYQKSRYFASKEELEIISSSATLEKWKVLSKAYKLGKKIWGHSFTRQKLAHDMDMPYTTTLRCLSLDKMTNKSKRLMKYNKISASKLSMICQTKSITYQDEIVDIVIKDKLSTYQIKSLRINNLKDINKERHRLAIEKGYSRPSSAADNFKRWIERGNLFLLMRKSSLTENKRKEICEDLKQLNNKIERYLQ